MSFMKKKNKTKTFGILQLTFTGVMKVCNKEFKDGPSQTSTTLVIIIDRTERAL